MHKSSYLNMSHFIEAYLDKKVVTRIIDIGSMNIHGCYKSLFDVPAWEYLGADIVKGANVDIILKDVYDWSQLPDNEFDVVISGQTFEHVEFFWLTIKEMARILKPGGLMCIIAPSGGKEHRYPVDCWRFYPDGMQALAKWAGLIVLEAYAQWNTTIHPTMDKHWRDCVLIAKKEKV